jgi:drug/metabolite transporter (DMT)-like permease
VAVLLGAFLFDEILTAAIIIGGTVTLTGLYIINFAMQRQRKRILIKN